MSFTRREFLKTSAMTVVATAMGAEDAVGQSADRAPLRQLQYSEVQLTGGPFAEQYFALKAHYLSLSNDRLVKVYRQRAGLPAPGDDMGGWYDRDGFVPGHGLGQYISGMARMGATTGDDACHIKAHDLVEGFAATLGAQNVSILRPETNLWTCYTVDKHLVGLLDAGTLSKVPGTTDLLNRVFEGAKSLLPAQGRDRIGKKDPPYDETYIMPENLFAASEATGNPAFREYAVRYLLDREFFDRLARKEDPFPGQHAYSHAIALSSGGKAYLSLGDVKYRDAMRHAFRLLTMTQQFSSGGWGPNETFITPHRGELYASLSTTVDHFETPCGAYAATKLARYLLRTGVPQDTAYADNLERVLFNTILGVKRPDSEGRYPYYSTYSPYTDKVYYKQKWPCCSGTLVQTVADYPLNIYFGADDGLYVTLYTPSRVQTQIKDVAVVLTQETQYPVDDHVMLIVNPSREATFALHLRIPGWLQRPATIRVNGKVETANASAGTFYALRRRWKAGDRVELMLPQEFRTESIDDRNPDVVALMRGPVQYVALNIPAVEAHAKLPLPSNLKAAGPQAYTERYAGRDAVFVPLYRIDNERYTSYFYRG
ncbi:twin-arginine translocation signal domain-containing protein [Terriglobus albidus]|uniref:Twin-arginine translocation signal domain-containing protein n=1 Tax=Terriglobus albidus TaxID=1592106 RepID=A0A5B9EDQ9_9BACT|nr:beta-L-arabinofuranosidase domain-containing protein [Terriglobus albidus]QEE29869.1 twin-arginine translocation signal domain-containing protein [Terriglobus albidus]